MTRIIVSARTWMSALALTMIRVASAQDAWLTVSVNGVPAAEPTLVHVDETDAYYVDAAAVAALHLPAAAIAGVVQLYGTQFVKLSDRPGMQVAHAPESDSLELTIDPWLYAAQESRAEDSGPSLTTGSLGFFANYDLFAEGGAFHERAVQLMAGASSGRYSVTSSGVASDGELSQYARLDTTFRADFPEYRASFGAGDLITSTVASPNAVRFAGLQWATDFATQPLFIPQAMPSTAGLAVVPSAVDLYVNGSSIAHRDVAAGPFSIQDVPIPVGTGLVELHVRDALGREQIIAQPFLVTPLLLRPGLTASSFELGVVREDYGLRSFEYGESFAAVAGRHGFTDSLTLQGGLQMLSDQSTARAAAVIRAGDRTVLQLGGGLSHADGYVGGTIDLALSVSGTYLDFGAEWHETGNHFTDLSMLDAGSRYRRSVSAQFSLRLPASSTLSMLYARRDPIVGDSGSVTTLSFSRAHLFGGSINAYASYAKFTSSDLSVGIVFTRSIGRASYSSGVSRDNTGSSLDFRTGRPADRDTVWGWDVGGRGGTDREAVGRLDAVTDYGSAEVQAATEAGKVGVSAGWHGGWIWADGQEAITAPLIGAVGLIEVPGAADVPVYQSGEIIGRTDSNGRVVATTLREFEPNQLTVNAADLPIEAWIDRSEITVRPYAHNILSITFPIHAGSANLRLVLPDGKPVPAGAVIGIGGIEAPVGDGGITTLPRTTDASLEARWSDGQCRIQMSAATWANAEHALVTVPCDPGNPP